MVFDLHGESGAIFLQATGLGLLFRFSFSCHADGAFVILESFFFSRVDIGSKKTVVGSYDFSNVLSFPIGQFVAIRSQL